MTKSDLIKIADKEWPNTEKMVNAIFRNMNIAFIKGEAIHISNFGTFKRTRERYIEYYDHRLCKTRIPNQKNYLIVFSQSRNIRQIMNKKQEVK